ncbi:MAG: hypothetical protein AB7E31_12730 [Desulfitobacterium sp.]
MHWFKAILSHKINHPIPPVEMDANEEKLWRISLLTVDERKAFEWFRLGYTARWTAETMLLDRKTAKRLFDSIYHKLCVVDEAEVSRVYRTLELIPEGLPPEENNP